MQYILTEDNVIDHNRYSQYLEGIKHLIDDNVYEFAANPDHFDLSSPSSLHDAWLEEFRVTENRNDDSGDILISGSITLLGPFHDRRIILEYAGVVGYDFCFVGEDRSRDGRVPRHGDVYTHEIRLEDGVLVHEILFVNDHRFLIKFRGFSRREECFPARSESRE